MLGQIDTSVVMGPAKACIVGLVAWSLSGFVLSDPILSESMADKPTQHKAADFSLPDIQGKQHKLSDYRGKWVVVNYWATWCPPCLEEIPELVEFHEAHQDKNAVVLGVDFEDVALEKLKVFVEDYFMNYPILRMKPAAGSELGIITGLPTTFLISPTGNVMAKQTGPVTKKMIEEFIKQETGKELAAHTQ